MRKGFHKLVVLRGWQKEFENAIEKNNMNLVELLAVKYNL